MGHCCKRDWNEKKNSLTWKLLSMGYTPENHPDYVRWDETHFEFEYTPEYVRKMVLESPCGLLMKGTDFNGYMSYMGIDWRLENDNSVHPCPYRKADCELNHKFLRRATGHKHNIVQCAFRFSDKVYDYENSYEKAWDDFYDMQECKRKDFYNRLKWNPEARHCNCIRWDDEKQDWYAEYDPWDCAHGCYVDDICVLTGRRLDGKKGNVFYDVKITRIRHDASLFDGEKMISITKGKKAFDNPKPLAICEAYAKSCKHWILDREKSRYHRELFFNPDTEIEVMNVRAEQRESRDLLQDLRDAQEGIEVVHASDLVKAKIQAKREKKEKRLKAKEYKRIKNLKQLLHDDNELLKTYAEKELKKRGIVIENKYEQLSFF